MCHLACCKIYIQSKAYNTGKAIHWRPQKKIGDSKQTIRLTEEMLIQQTLPLVVMKTYQNLEVEKAKEKWKNVLIYSCKNL